jgi:hypothetical protein
MGALQGGQDDMSRLGVWESAGHNGMLNEGRRVFFANAHLRQRRRSCTHRPFRIRAEMTVITRQSKGWSDTATECPSCSGHTVEQRVPEGRWAPSVRLFQTGKVKVNSFQHFVCVNLTEARSNERKKSNRIALCPVLFASRQDGDADESDGFETMTVRCGIVEWLPDPSRDSQLTPRLPAMVGLNAKNTGDDPKQPSTGNRFTSQKDDSQNAALVDDLRRYKSSQCRFCQLT